MVNLIEERASVDGTDFKIVFGTPGYQPIPMNIGFLQNADQVHVLVTIAILFMQPIPALVREEAQAIVTLALYAAGAEAALDDWQYTMLTKLVKRYLEPRHEERKYFSPDRFPQTSEEDLRNACNWAMVNHVLQKAATRAELANLQK